MLSLCSLIKSSIEEGKIAEDLGIELQRIITHAIQTNHCLDCQLEKYKARVSRLEDLLEQYEAKYMWSRMRNEALVLKLNTAKNALILPKPLADSTLYYEKARAVVAKNVELQSRVQSLEQLVSDLGSQVAVLRNQNSHLAKAKEQAELEVDVVLGANVGIEAMVDTLLNNKVVNDYYRKAIDKFMRQSTDLVAQTRLQ